MHKIGIFSGGGQLPLIIGQKLKDLNYEIVFFCIKDQCKINLYKKYNHEIILINSLSKILKTLKDYKIEKIIMAGRVKRPSIKDIKFDLHSLTLIRKLALDSKGDDKLLSSIADIFKNKGFPIFNWKSICSDLFIKEKFLTKIKPSKISNINKKFGLKFFEKIGKIDIAQSLIIQNKIILGIEAVEGTDELIKRCAKYKKVGDKGILLKLSKYNQSEILDIPVIGINTLRNIKKYGYEGVFVELNKCILIDKKEVINFCNKNRIFISCVEKN